MAIAVGVGVVGGACGGTELGSTSTEGGSDAREDAFEGASDMETSATDVVEDDGAVMLDAGFDRVPPPLPPPLPPARDAETQDGPLFPPPPLPPPPPDS
jgi:hypothetical protein